MAVENKNVDTGAAVSSAASVSTMRRALQGSGAEVGALFTTFEKAAADSNASVYRVFHDLDKNLIPLQIWVANDAITTGTDYGVGLYEATLGAVINKDAFAAGLDLSTAHASLNPKTALDGMKDVVIESSNKRLYEHAGHTVANQRDTYDIALTADAAGSGAGTISVLMVFARG